MRRKITIDIIRQEAQEHGYELISKEYHNCEELLEFYCPIDNHGPFHLSYHKFKSNRGCQKCSAERKHKKISLSFEEVNQYIESQDYKLLDDEYINSHTKLLLKCPIENHEPFPMTYAAFHSGERCPECSGVKKHTLEEINQYAQAHGYELLSTTYKNNKEELVFKCPNNHTFSMRFNDFQQGHRCPTCKGLSCSERQYLNPNNVREFIEKERYKLKSDYVSSREFLDMECPNGHPVKIRYNDFQQGVRCDRCVREGLRGENSPNWKGGKTKLYNALRYCIENWRIEQLRMVENKCELTGEKSSRKVILNVHHIEISFSNILDAVFNELKLPILKELGDYSTKEIVMLESLIKETNEKLAIPVIMEKEIHKKFHSFCHGYDKPTTFRQLKDFCDAESYTFPERYIDKLL